MNFAYIHCRPDGTPFYVGKGKRRRVRNLGERNPYHKAVVAKYGRENILVGALECTSDQIAYELEAGLIRCIEASGIRLTNFCAGGVGTPAPSEESRKRMSEAAKLRGVSEVSRRNLVRKGTVTPDVVREKLRMAQTGKVFSEEHRRNISISAKRRGMSLACREAWRAKHGK